LAVVRYTDTTFSDSGLIPISGGISPYTGTFQPVIAARRFIGSDPIGNTNGVWSLEVFDDYAGDTGTLLNWTLHLSTGVAVTGQLPATQTWSLAIDPRSDSLYVGTDQGVWKLANASESQSYNWTRSAPECRRFKSRSGFGTSR